LVINSVFASQARAGGRNFDYKRFQGKVIHITNLRMEHHSSVILKKYLIAIKVLTVITLIAPACLFAQSTEFLRHSLSLGAYFSEGDYGEISDTRVRYFPISYKYQNTHWGYQLTMPYLEVDGIANVLIDTGGVSGARGRNAFNATSGVGDLMASINYQFDAVTDSNLFFNLLLEAKIPTADDQEGLGTGRFDYGIRLDMQTAVSGSTVFGSLGYKFRGETSLYPDLKNSVYLELGVMWPMRDAISTGVIYTYITPASSFSEEIHELLPFVNWALADNWSLMSYAVWGATQDSPDFALGLQLSYRW
jgi:hypothetical protein